MNAINKTDGYKLDHRRQYPEGTNLVYSNWTPRKSRLKGVNGVVFAGLQAFLQKMTDDFEREFFSVDEDYAVKVYQEKIDRYLGPNEIGTDHIRALHKLGYLPIEVRALPEGTIVPIRVAMFTVHNTLPEFFWITNYLETLFSLENWLPSTSATIANEFRIKLDSWADKTSDIPEFVDFQAHDFSMRGHTSVDSAQYSGFGHALSFMGSDTYPVIDFVDRYYHNDLKDESLIVATVPATEHSVMCMGTKDDEFETFKRLITEVYPSGIVSIVSDTWDLWKVLTDYMPRLKNEIMARDGKVVIRPDSGTPADIICGYTVYQVSRLEYDNTMSSSFASLPSGIDSDATDFVITDGYEYTHIEKWEYIQSGLYMPSGITHNFKSQAKGVVELLWDTFGGDVNSKGYLQLDSHVGAIYGDAITIERTEDICQRLADKLYASTNVVLGIGSYTYVYNTRDTFGFAIKATYGEVNGEGREIFKDPITDDGTKKSARGKIIVLKDENGQLFMVDQQKTWEGGEMELVYRNGQMKRRHTLTEIRNNLKESNRINLLETA